MGKRIALCISIMIAFLIATVSGISIQSRADDNTPPTPKNLRQISATDDSVTVTWDAVDSWNVYQVIYSKTELSDPDFGTSWEVFNDANNIQYTIKNLEKDTIYYLYVRAVNVKSAYPRFGMDFFGSDYLMIKICAKAPVDITDFTVKIPEQIVYSGKSITPSFTLKDGGSVLKKNVDYTVEYKNNVNVGKATIEINGIGDYSGSIIKTFNIIPKKASLTKVIAGNKSFKATWKPQKTKMKKSFITGYQLQYSTTKNFAKGNKTVTINVPKYSTKTKTVKKLIKGKKYYVRLRTYKTVGGEKYYSDWSSTKTVKIK
ncbi:MAG: fibronectin type III domain-containing protein [Eubacterium sp.]|nr:fibronectin type III domain-containing protein [Eubacterium sp.]